MGRYILGSNQGSLSELKTILLKENLNLDADKLGGSDANEYVQTGQLDTIIDQNINKVTIGINKPTFTSHSNGYLLHDSNAVVTTVYSFPYQKNRNKHTASDWEIATDSNFNNIVDSTYKDLVNLTEWRPGNLTPNTNYYLRTRHYNYCIRSDWSDTLHLITSSSWVNIPPPVIIQRKNVYKYGSNPQIEIDPNAATNLPAGVVLQNIYYEYINVNYTRYNDFYINFNSLEPPTAYSWARYDPSLGIYRDTIILTAKYKTNKGDSSRAYKVIHPNHIRGTMKYMGRLPFGIFGHTSLWLKASKRILITGGYKGYSQNYTWNTEKVFIDRMVSGATRENGIISNLERDAAIINSTGNGGTEDILIMIGGDASGGTTGTVNVRRYNISTNSVMSDLPPLPIPLTQCKVVMFSNGDIMTIGGYSNGNKNSVPYYFSFSSNTWTAKAPMGTWVTRFGATATYDDYVVVYGGLSDLAPVNGSNFKHIQLYNLANNTWQVDPTDFSGTFYNGTWSYDYICQLDDDGRILGFTNTWSTNQCTYWSHNQKNLNVQHIAYLVNGKSISAGAGWPEGPISVVKVPGVDYAVITGGISNRRELMDTIHIIETPG